MKDALALLVAAQRLDERALVLGRRLDLLPAELAERVAEVRRLEAAEEALEAERKAALIRAQELENDVRRDELRLRKIESQVREMRDAGAVAVMEHEAQELRDRVARAEEQALQLLERAETLAPEREGARAAAAARAVELERFRAAVAADQAELGAQVAELAVQRDALLARAPAEAADAYRRLLKARKGIAVAELRGSSCSACGMVMPPNDRLHVLAMHEIATCRSCGRILVSGELWSTAAAGVDPAGG